MIELYIIRHGLAGEHGSYANDNERPLTDEGRKKTQKIAKRLQELDLEFDRMQTSPLVRAKQTAEILCKAGLSQHLEESHHLAPGGNLEVWLKEVEEWRRSPDSHKLAIVGHEPDLSTWAKTLIWGNPSADLELKKGGIIGLRLPDSEPPIGASQLFWLTPPKFLI